VGLEREVHALPAVVGDDDRVARGREDRLDDQKNVFVVVNDQDFFSGHGRTSSSKIRDLFRL